jgi:hypothetical protein
MARDEVQPVTAQQPIEGELNVLTMSKEQILNLISTTHLPDEEKIEADYSLLVAVEHERAKYLKRGHKYYFQVYMFLPSFIIFLRFFFFHYFF